MSTRAMLLGDEDIVVAGQSRIQHLSRSLMSILAARLWLKPLSSSTSSTFFLISTRASTICMPMSGVARESVSSSDAPDY